MKKKHCSYALSGILVLISVTLLPSIGPLRAQLGIDNDSLSERKVRLLADAVLHDATFRLVDEKTGEGNTSAIDAQLKPESRYNDWRYWNGVLNMAMLRLGEVLKETPYTDFVLGAVAFDFDNYGYFKERYNGQDKWSYPFGQMIVMKELDDYGAMGASLIEAHRLDHQGRYLAYIDSAAAYLKNRQSRMPDGTFARAFPKQWTVWADDLFMSVPFLARLGELTGDTSYFDDAARQVINFNKYLFDEKKTLMHHSLILRRLARQCSRTQLREQSTEDISIPVMTISRDWVGKA